MESRCRASATSSLPEPVGPSISTGVERAATRRMRRLTSSIAGLVPTSSGIRSAAVATVRAGEGEGECAGALWAGICVRSSAENAIPSPAAPNPSSPAGPEFEPGLEPGLEPGCPAKAGAGLLPGSGERKEPAPPVAYRESGGNSISSAGLAPSPSSGARFQAAVSPSWLRRSA